MIWISNYINQIKDWNEWLFDMSYRMIDMKMGIEKYFGTRSENDRIDILNLHYEDEIGSTRIYKKNWRVLFFKTDWNRIFKEQNIRDMMEYFREKHLDEIYHQRQLYENNRSDMRLRIHGKYMKKEFILYIPYENGIKIKNSVYKPFISYPFYDKERMNLYREDIIYPYYVLNPKKKYELYSCFQVDSKNIKKIKINDMEMGIQIKELFEKLRTPFYDFGILYHYPMKIKWILEEMKYDTNNFKKIEIEFMELLFDEDSYDLKPHTFCSENMNDYFITEHMKQKIIKRNEEIGREIEFHSSSKNK